MNAAIAHYQPWGVDIRDACESCGGGDEHEGDCPELTRWDREPIPYEQFEEFERLADQDFERER